LWLKYRSFWGGGRGSATPYAFPPPWPSIFPIILCPPPCYPGWPASPCTCNGLRLFSHIAVFSVRTIIDPRETLLT
jgi:hypothetical protein